MIESIRRPRSESPFFTPGFPLSAPLEHAVRITSFDGPPTGPFESPGARPLMSDTGELNWRSDGKHSGVVTVNTPRSQALIGYAAKSGEATRNLRLDVNPPFCAVTLSTLDDQPIARSSTLLLTATARIANTGMEWNDRRTSLVRWGAAPTLIEPVTGHVILKNLDGARRVTARPLDGAGRPLARSIHGAKTADGWMLQIGEPPTTWFVITVTR